VGEDEVGTLGIGGWYSGGACMSKKSRLSCEGVKKGSHCTVVVW